MICYAYEKKEIQKLHKQKGNGLQIQNLQQQNNDKNTKE
jgi:hypothetical protein